jgi:hypothetical protein
MRRIGIVLSATVVAALVAGCGGGSTVRVARISGVHIVEGQSHTIWVDVETKGTCVGSEQEPELQSLKLDERPGDEAVLSASVRYFANKGSLCNGIGLGLERAVHTRRPARRLAVYDGSESPPRNLGVEEMTRHEFQRQMRTLRHNARAARRDER